MNKRLAILTLLMLITGIASFAGERYNFNADWKLALGRLYRQDSW